MPSDNIPREAVKAAIEKAIIICHSEYAVRFGEVVIGRQFTNVLRAAIDSIPAAEDGRWEKLRAWVKERSSDYVRYGSDPLGHLDSVLAEINRLSSPAERDGGERVERPPMLLAATGRPFGDKVDWRWFVRSGSEWMMVESDVYICESKRLREVDRTASDPEALRLYLEDIGNGN